MAEVVASGSQDYAFHAAPDAPHGRKRAGDNSLEGEQRLSKRFDLLNLEHNGARLYIPVSGSTGATQPVPPPAVAPSPYQHSVPDPDGMSVEDTPHRIYIADLAAELDAASSDDEHPVFLADIEKHLAKIPLHILAGPAPKPSEHNQVVLYNVPTSLSVPEERDSVRKAIVETRRRIRERQANGLPEVYGEGGMRDDSRDRGRVGRGETIARAAAAAPQEEDYDAMDID